MQSTVSDRTRPSVFLIFSSIFYPADHWLISNERVVLADAHSSLTKEPDTAQVLDRLQSELIFLPLLLLHHSLI